MGDYDALPLIGVAVLVIVGLMIVIKAGNKIGWIVLAVAAVWGYHTISPIVSKAQPGVTTPEQGKDYYQIPAKK